MKKFSVSVILLIILMLGYVFIFPHFEKSRIPIRKIQSRGLILHPAVVKLLALEFRTITADFLFARASQYLGGKIESRESATASDIQWLYNNLVVITDLDPYFEDAYYFGNAILTWEARAYNEANALLKKGTEARTWDWQLPFFLGFNKFYFLKDNKGAADYILEAAKRPGAHDFLPTLAARLYNSSGRTASAIEFLTVFWQGEKDERLKRKYAIRIEALKRISFLEQAAFRYREKTGKLPRSLEVLVRSGIIQRIPKDPYGGSFYIGQDGSVMTTSNLALKLPGAGSGKSSIRKVK